MSFQPRLHSDWSSLVGKNADVAKQAILDELCNWDIKIVKQGTPSTMDYRTNRIRIVVDDNNKVVGKPMIG
jgi:hypothetical protein